MERQPPPGEGYHVCEVRIQGLFLHFPITFISGSFQFREHQNDQKWQKVSRFFFKNQSFRVTTKMPVLMELSFIIVKELFGNFNSEQIIRVENGDCRNIKEHFMLCFNWI